MAASPLTVPEGIALLLLRDADGRRAVEAATFRSVLAAGALAELAVRGVLGLDASGRVVITVRAAASGAAASGPAASGPAEPVLCRIVDEVAASSARTDEWWVGRLSAPALTDGILDALVGRGIVTERSRTFLGFPVAPAYPALRGAEEEVLRGALRSALAVDHRPSPRVAATVALLDVVGRLSDVAGVLPEGGVALRPAHCAGHWPAAALQAWLLGGDPVVGGALRTSIERGDTA